MILNLKTLFIVLICLLTSNLALQAQSLNAYERAGDLAYEQHDYYNAVYYYEIVLKSKKKTGIYYKYAESCRHAFAYQKAEDAYQKVTASKEASHYEFLYFYYALTLKHNGRYEAAAKAFQQFINKYNKKDYFWAKAQQELASCAVAQNIVKEAADTIEITRLNDQINTEFSDFGAHETKDGQLYYSSLRFERKSDAEATKGQKDPTRLVAKLLNSKDGEAKGQLVAGLNHSGMHNANSTLSRDEKRLYFTRCSADRNDSIICQLYLSYRQENGTWSKPYHLAAPFNTEGYSSTQPHLVWDEKTGIEHLYFVSNRVGGFGGMDIWQLEVEKDSIGKNLQNLGLPINSIDQEASPFYHVGSSTLYFSSQWHHGLGGYDVFRSKILEDGTWSMPENLGVPINSAANDFYWILNSNDSTGYFASNRAGSKTITEESCCNDIYRFTVHSKNNPPPSNLITELPPKGDTLSIVSIVPTPKTPSVLIEELNNMLPLKLYFHNDEPDSNTTSTTTFKPYELPYRHYISLQKTYVEEYASQFDVEMRPVAANKVNLFFEEEVKGEYHRMNAFFDKLLELLAAGIPLELHLKGYTSPRSNEGYNDALAQRRITSVRKQLFYYKNGAFLPYFQQSKLIVKELPLGERQAPKGISDAFDDPKNSINSVEASKERRAEIVVIKKQ